MKKIFIVVGTRPNFIKAYPLMEAFKKKKDDDAKIYLINTNQHYDKEMAEGFLNDFNMKCQINLYKTHISDIIYSFEIYCIAHKPDLVIIFGDTDSSMACALVAGKMNIPLAHIEAGERSYNLQMQEEKNRLIIDALSNYLFCSSEEAYYRLIFNEPILYYDKKIHNVGNIHADAIRMILDKTKYIPDYPYGKYAVVTLHRAENVDNKERLEKILTLINDIAKEYKYKFDIIFPAHPRTEARLEDFNISFSMYNNIKKIKPFNYTSFIRIIKNALFVMTDSGGLQTETTMLDIPCLTLRNETEWGITITDGTNFLVKDEYMNMQKLKPMIDNILGGRWKTAKDIKYWDGKTAERIVNILAKEE